MPTKVAIIYYSQYGTNHAMAHRVASTAEKLGAEVRRRHVAENAPREVWENVDGWREHVQAMQDEPSAEPDDLDWADVAIFGSPTRYGHVTGQMQAYLDTLGPLWMQGRLQDKVYAAFTSSQTRHGGQETTLLAMLTTFAHLGGIIVPPGYTDQLKFNDGNPYGVSKVTGQNPELDDEDAAALDHLVERAVTFGERLAAA